MSPRKIGPRYEPKPNPPELLWFIVLPFGLIRSIIFLIRPGRKLSVLYAIGRIVALILAAGACYFLLREQVTFWIAFTTLVGYTVGLFMGNENWNIMSPVFYLGTIIQTAALGVFWVALVMLILHFV